eukprot:15456721-Alexandrium_andersonii.AAC.1
MREAGIAVLALPCRCELPQQFHHKEVPDAMTPSSVIGCACACSRDMMQGVSKSLLRPHQDCMRNVH